MDRQPMNIAIIPARGGSRRIPLKNIRPFCGQPIIGWSIQQALQTHLFDRVVVSTDHAKTADIARHYGAEVPFMRPANLSDDFATTVDVIAHAVDALQQKSATIKRANVCCFYATAPLTQRADLAQGLKKLTASDCDYVFSAAECSRSVYRALTIDTGGAAALLFPQYSETRSQDLPIALHDAGQFYWGNASTWRQRKPILGGHSIPLVIPNHRVQDIDVDADWQRAEQLFKQLRLSLNQTIVSDIVQ